MHQVIDIIKIKNIQMYIIFTKKKTSQMQKKKKYNNTHNMYNYEGLILYILADKFN